MLDPTHYTRADPLHQVYLFSRVAMLPLHAYRRKMEKRILGQYGDVLHEEQASPSYHP